MIFITVGTDHHPFNRVFAWARDAVRHDIIRDAEPVVIQHGYTEGDWNGFEAYRFLPFNQMVRYFEDADLIVTHGSSTAMLAIRYGQVPIVVPREKKLGESVDNHQLEFVDATEAIFPFVVARTEPEFFQALRNRESLTQTSKERYMDERSAAMNRFTRLFTRLVEESAGKHS